MIQSIETNRPLNEGSVLLLSNGLVIGMIQEMFGPLTSPFYVLKWHKNREVPQSFILDEINNKLLVFFVRFPKP